MKKKNVEERANRPNCGIIPPMTDTTVLTYAMGTVPDPLYAASENAVLQFVISNLYENTSTGTGVPLLVKSIVLGIPVGPGGLVPGPLNTGNYAISDSQNWDVVINPTPSQGIQNITITSENEYVFPFDGNLVLSIYDVNTVATPGNTNISITETIVPPEGVSNFPAQPSYSYFQVSVFPAGFFLDNLVASIKSGSQLVPVAQVSQTEGVVLTWSSSVTNLSNITIYWSDPVHGQQSANPSEAGTWPATPLMLTCDTVFTIVATMEVFNQPMTLSRTVAVSVENPSLVASSLATSVFNSVNGNFDFNNSTSGSSVFSVNAAPGSTTAILNTNGGTNSWAQLQLKNPTNTWILSTANNYVNNEVSLTSSTSGAASLAMDVLGNVRLNNNVTVQQSVRINGNTATGQGPALSLGGLGALNVDAQGITGGRFTVQDSGNVGINNANPSANLHVNGSTILNGSVSAIGGSQTINAGTYTAPTDGFAIAVVQPPAQLQHSQTLVYCQCNGVSVSAMGGCVSVYYDGGSDATGWNGINSNSCTLPVSKGAQFSVSSWTPDGWGGATAVFYWIPLGQGGVQTLERIGDAPVIPEIYRKKVRGYKSRPTDIHDLDIRDLMEVLNDIFGDKMDDKKRKKLNAAIHRIVYFEVRKYSE